MSDEKLVSLMNEARLISASDNVLYPLIDLKIKQRLDLACSRFVGGETNFIADIAYIQGLKEIKLKLQQMQEAGNKAALQLNKDNI